MSKCKEGWSHVRDFRKANLGMTLEEFLNHSNQIYTRDGIAVVWKVPTAFKPIRNAYGQVVSCKVEGKSCVDYLGRVKKIPLAVEAKETSSNDIRFDRVEDHQAYFLDAYSGQNEAICLVVVSFSLNSFYAVPWAFWKAGRDAWKEAQRLKKRKAERITVSHGDITWTTPGRAAVKEEELHPAWKIETGGRYGLDYLQQYIRQGTIT